MKNIKQVVNNEEWQTLRRSMEHTWNSEPSSKRNLLKLKRYLNNTKNEES